MSTDHAGLGEVAAVVVPFFAETVEIRLRVRDVTELTQRVGRCRPFSPSFLGQRGDVPVREKEGRGGQHIGVGRGGKVECVATRAHPRPSNAMATDPHCTGLGVGSLSASMPAW